MTETTVNLGLCDEEPIHIPGCIQPHGALLVCNADDDIIRYCSENAVRVLRLDKEIVGTTLRDTFGPTLAHECRNAAARGRSLATSGIILARDVKGQKFDVSAHELGGRMILEFEPVNHAVPDAESAMDVALGMVQRLGAVTTLDRLAEAAARLCRAFLGFDRVDVCRFLADGTGRVIAEAKRATIAGFIGHHFPASDIPQQARALYLKLWLRSVVDSSYVASPLIPQLGPDDVAIDLSQCVLRSMSPIHCEYLRNMGVVSSFSMSIVVDGRLWGLIACHHESPRHVAATKRIIAELFAQFFSLQVALCERRQNALAMEKSRHVVSEFVGEVRQAVDLDVALEAQLARMVSLVPSCDGAAMWLRGRWTCSGVTPSLEGLSALLAHGDTVVGKRWETSEASALFGQSGSPAGILHIPLDTGEGDCLFFFRREQAQRLIWAGPPAKIASVGPHGQRLTPRGSFDTWQEDVRGKAEPWTDEDVAIVDVLINYVREMALLRRRAADERRVRDDERRKLVNQELHHRVKNIISIVKSIAVQSGSSASSVSEYAKSLNGRLLALALAHDQSLSERGGAVTLLFRAMSEMHWGNDGSRVNCDGPPLTFDAKAFSALALLLHELMTNATKYGALSLPSGSVYVTWWCDEAGACHIAWRESGGPAVTPPTRRGFGTKLLEATVSYDLGGQLTLEYPVEGFRATILIPGQHVIRGDQPSERVRVSDVVGSTTLEARRVLIVEDQILIALDLENSMWSLGARDVRSVGTVDAALAAIEEFRPDCVLLDVVLGDATSAPVAARLRKQGIPFAYLTGYSDNAMIPSAYLDVPVAHKPATTESLAQALNSALGGSPQDFGVC